MHLILLALVGLVAFIFHQFYWRRRNLPPGPFPLPLIGNLHQIILGKKTLEDTQIEWRKQYGDIFTMWQGNNPIVIVSDYNLCYDLFVKDADSYIGRGIEHDFIQAVRGGVGGVILTENDCWREQRRFALHTLRDFGLGKNFMQEKILEEVVTLHSRIDRHSELENDVAVNDLIDISVGSIINCILFGYRYSDDKLEEFNDLRERARRFMAISGDPIVLTIRSSGIVNIFKHLPGFKEKFDKTYTNGNYLVDFFRERIADYKKSRSQLGDDDQEEPTDFVQAFMMEKKKRDKEGGQHYFNDNQLTSLLFDLWIAGQETTSNTLGWGIAHLVHQPQIQQRIHDEMDKVIGSDRLVNLADKNDLPYLCAVINEMQRIANLLPINVIHKTTKDVKIRDYNIKEGTWIVPEISLILYDPNIFDDPKIFNPDRFIDSNGKLKACPELIPFSLGKRQCLGEGLARMELFIFLANLMNQYKFMPAKQMPSLTRHNGITVRAEDYKCRVVKRFT